MFSPAGIPAPSAALIMEELLEDSPLAGSRASAAFTVEADSMAEVVEAFTGAEVMAAEVAGNSAQS